ncbi:hypothetical protein DES53_111105 [Roseimicrobium gellanilyticum]|uniref:Uncharacterized protein n=1 Tax=Roseimicrobium gellanilyticum TaxID=748857 RepID=A0A366HA75_9BACT|nr:hypothetical protein [Roseimicrobium gellanilyticum]RBP38586.1 hypothetical protein DES53_111105 [Roseimicrobium gellanilyticum]
MSEGFSALLGPLGTILLLISAVLGTQKRRPVWRTWTYVIIIGVLGSIACRSELQQRDAQRKKTQRLEELRDKLKASRQ